MSEDDTFTSRFPVADYDGLNGRQQERVNFAQVATRLALRGFTCYWLDDDWNGADFLAYHTPSGETSKTDRRSYAATFSVIFGWRFRRPATGSWSRTTSSSRPGSR